MEYTKGEWTKDGNKIKVLGKGTIAICPSPTNSEGVFEFVANAHLIAASPEMYEALKACHAANRCHNDEEARLFDLVRSALAKADAK